MPIQSETFIEVSELDFDSETSKRLLIGSARSKDLNVCAERFSFVSPLRLTLDRLLPLGSRVGVTVSYDHGQSGCLNG